MGDEITSVMLIYVRRGKVGIVILSRAGIGSLGGLGEDVVNGLSKLGRRRWNVHGRLRRCLAR